MTQASSTFDFRNMRREVAGAGRNIWFAGLGVLATVEESTRSLFGDLVEKGRKFDRREKTRVEKTVDRTVEEARRRARELGRRVEGTVHSGVATVLHRVGVPNEEEIRTLIRRVEELTAKVEQLKTEGS